MTTRSLLVTDHAIRRFSQAVRAHKDKLPPSSKTLLGIDGVRNVKGLVKSMVKFIMNSRRVTIPEKAYFWKLIKHGIKDHIFYRHMRLQRIVFNIVREKEHDVLVTVVEVPFDRIHTNKIYSEDRDSYGAVYLSELSEFRLRYNLNKAAKKKYAEVPPVVGIMSQQIPLIFNGKKYKRS